MKVEINSSLATQDVDERSSHFKDFQGKEWGRGDTSAHVVGEFWWRQLQSQQFRMQRLVVLTTLID
ncbi:hypothetical protein PRUPE_2G160300 [Prunus persica]|uniref:Uncharacterized protein n=1 Tax=Prunus persica TaxID=3760 RepID=A0A251QGI6_PRUPE|nr:hypothetical protein PRUPE_2G160300 [Prunus persica]